MKPYSALKRIFRIALVAMTIAQSGQSPFAAHTAAAHPHPGGRPSQPAPLNCFCVLGDFDGDQRVDQAELHLSGAHRCIRVRFSDSRETHLELRETPRASGALLTLDINSDNNPDLIWINHFQSAPAEAWLGDGLGEFAKADDATAAEALRAILFGDSNPGLVGGVNEEKSLLAPAPVSHDLARTAHRGDEVPSALSPSWRSELRAFGLHLTYLGERAPPLPSSFV